VRTRSTLQALRFRARIIAKNTSQITALESLRRKFFVTIVLRMKSESRTSTINGHELKAR
jgi:glutamate racemase